MSENCISCIVNKRTGPDLKCDDCRSGKNANMVMHEHMIASKKMSCKRCAAKDAELAALKARLDAAEGSLRQIANYNHSWMRGTYQDLFRRLKCIAAEYFAAEPVAEPEQCQASGCEYHDSRMENHCKAMREGEAYFQYCPWRDESNGMAPKPVAEPQQDEGKCIVCQGKGYVTCGKDRHVCKFCYHKRIEQGGEG